MSLSDEGADSEQTTSTPACDRSVIGLSSQVGPGDEVSLEVSAADTEGSTIEQTIIDRT